MEPGPLQPTAGDLPITVVIAARNEAPNIERCVTSAQRAARVCVVDSQSTDGTDMIARRAGAEVTQFAYSGGYPKKRQWALEVLGISTPWVLLLDADEAVPHGLWEEIAATISSPQARSGYLITKGFHFLHRRLRFGGFSHSAVLLFRTGRARFENLIDCPESQQDMEVHERLIVDGAVGRLKAPLIHEDFKGLYAYLDRHNRYSTWEASLRYIYLRTGQYGRQTIRPRFWGDAQERRRFLKTLAVRMPFEPWLWFIYHYFLRLGLLEGVPGLIASRTRAAYIAQVRAKMYELSLRDRGEHH